MKKASGGISGRRSGTCKGPVVGGSVAWSGTEELHPKQNKKPVEQPHLRWLDPLQ